MHRYDHRKPRPHEDVDLGLDASTRRVHLQRRCESPALFEKIEDWMRVLGYPHRDLFAVQLALHEALSNAFRHGNANDPSKSVRVRYLVTAWEVLVEVADQGPGFDPASVPSPLADDLSRLHGRGLFLMRVYSSWVSFNREGNRVTLCRLRSET